MPKRWRKFRVYHTQGNGQRHTEAFATRRAAERHAEEMRVREGITEVFVKYTDGTDLTPSRDT